MVNSKSEAIQSVSVARIVQSDKWFLEHCAVQFRNGNKKHRNSKMDHICFQSLLCGEYYTCITRSQWNQINNSRFAAFISCWCRKPCSRYPWGWRQYQDRWLLRRRGWWHCHQSPSGRWGWQRLQIKWKMPIRLFVKIVNIFQRQ